MEQSRGRRTRAGAAQLVPRNNPEFPFRINWKPTDWAETSGMPRPIRLQKSRSRNRSGQDTAVNALVEAVISSPEPLEEVEHSTILVPLAREVVRKAAP